ncbi:uncharacterized protein C2845_PM11G12150 [Panicum miliaceum]|uniref:Uncharacterized protein n=1 Tax=Panicum miliaceum TaxID=4540 RepID=A0A3L6RNI9_PANMI|nr:uncharacterized protein C2845_PM11G12150 [Panicum miliaceum]
MEDDELTPFSIIKPSPQWAEFLLQSQAQLHRRHRPPEFENPGAAGVRAARRLGPETVSVSQLGRGAASAEAESEDEDRMVVLVVATTSDPASIGPAAAFLAMPGWSPGPPIAVINSPIPFHLTGLLSMFRSKFYRLLNVGDAKEGIQQAGVTRHIAAL